MRKQKNVSRCAINLRDGGYLFISVVVFVFVMVLCFSDLNLSDNNSLPITLEQLGLWDDNEEFSLRETSVESQPALFAKVTEYTDCIEKKDGAQSYIRYTIVKSRFSSILEKYKAGGYTYLAPVLLGEKQSIRDDRWDAKRVIEFTFNDDKCLLIIYEDTLLWINRDGLSDEQVAVFRNFIKK